MSWPDQPAVELACVQSNSAFQPLVYLDCSPSGRFPVAFSWDCEAGSSPCASFSLLLYILGFEFGIFVYLVPD